MSGAISGALLVLPDIAALIRATWGYVLLRFARNDGVRAAETLTPVIPRSSCDDRVR